MMLLHNGANIHTCGQFFIECATAAGSLEMVRTIVNMGMDIHQDEDRALIMALNHQKFDIARYLLDIGANIHAREDAALASAVLSGNIALAKLLIERGADVNTIGDCVTYYAVFYSSPVALHAISIAAYNGYVEMFNLLVDSGADIRIGRDQVLEAAILGKSIPIIRYLLGCGMRPEYRHHAAMCDTILGSPMDVCLPVVDLLLDNGVDINYREGMPLRAALASCNTAMASYLLARGADIDAGHGTALMSMISRRRIDSIRFLLSNGANPNIHCANFSLFGNHTPLSLAADLRCHDIFMLLLNNGADCHAENDMAFMAACGSGDVRIIAALLERGVDVDERHGLAIRNAIGRHSGEQNLVDLLRLHQMPSNPSSSPTPVEE